MPKVDSGDTTFVLMSAALVLLMTPGLAFFYGGLVRRKNALNTMMMSFVAMAVVGVVWMVAGYSLAFSHGPFDRFVGGLSYLGLRGVGAAPNPEYAATVPHTAFMLYQAMFAVITPALVSGAVAERMKFSAYVLFCAAWSLLVYAPVAHWAWAPEGFLHRMGLLDFAGGTVVHLNAGAAALVAALLVGPRKGFPKSASVPHHVPFVLLGMGLLWFGWLGFNGGSALSAGALAASAFVATFAAAASGGLVWTLFDRAVHGKMTAVGLASGVVAGLVGITPASGFVGPMAALVIGALAAGVSFFAVRLKGRLGFDDALDVFGIHGVSGLLGAVATGAFASLAVNAAGADGSLKLVGVQLFASLVTLAYSGVMSFGLLKLLQATVGLRVDEQAEYDGADISEHGERGYSDLDVAPHFAPREERERVAPRLPSPVREIV